MIYQTYLVMFDIPQTEEPENCEVNSKMRKFKKKIEVKLQLIFVIGKLLFQRLQTL